MGVDAYGALATSGHEDNISEAIQIILGTAIGERIMRPEFGCRIHDLVFHPVNPNTCALASISVREAITKWEPFYIENNNCIINPGNISTLFNIDGIDLGTVDLIDDDGHDGIGNTDKPSNDNEKQSSSNTELDYEYMQDVD